MVLTLLPLKDEIINCYSGKGESEIWAQVEAPGFFYTTTGKTINEVFDNFTELIADYMQHEGKDNPAWAGVRIQDIELGYLDRAVRIEVGAPITPS